MNFTLKRFQDSEKKPTINPLKDSSQQVSDPTLA